jgi:hypothetical protein
MMFLYQTIAPSVLLCLSMNKNNPSFQAAKTTAYSRCSRRKILSDVVGKATLTGAAVLVFPVVGRAEDPLFRPNPLTNRVLEKVSLQLSIHLSLNESKSGACSHKLWPTHANSDR